MFKVNDRVKTRFGTGVVKSFEILSSEKCEYIDEVSDDFKGRICVRLDEGHTWSFKDHLCCFYKHELELL